MYGIIISLHIIFIFLSYLLWYHFFIGIFFLSWLFLLFYFSPIFFLETSKKIEKKSLSFNFDSFFETISPKDSIFIPLTLLYGAFYSLIFALFWWWDLLLTFHSIFLLAVFLLLLWYTLSFQWRNDIFFEVFRYHTIIAFSTTILFWVWIFFNVHPSYIILFLGISSTLAGIFFYSNTREKVILFSLLFFLSTFSTLFTSLSFFFPRNTFSFFLSLVVIYTITVFEFISTIKIFHPQQNILRYFSLIFLFLFLPLIFWTLFSTITLPYILLIPVTLFFFSIHLRYSNYIAYGIALGIVFLLYSILFITLLSPTSLLSTFLFLFFLPFLIIGTTYFWEESHEYDFIILHYSSILFSGIYSIYSILFIWWGQNIFFMISSCIFGLALLFFLSYFRFRKT